MREGSKANQFTGLAHCQSRKKESLDFAFNMSLSSINLARAFARSCGVHLSVSNVKTLIHNADMIQRFIRMSGKRPHRLLTQLLPFELFSKKFCLNISELGLEIV